MRIGIVGAGSMGSVHAGAWQQLATHQPEVELVGLVSSTPDSARSLGEAHGVRVYPDLDALFGDVDVADLCVPTDLHAPLTERAAAAGVHVICEKPVALTLDQADAMSRACEAAGVRLFVALVVRFFPQYARAAELIHSGRLGELGVLRLRRVAYPPRGGAGWFHDETRSGGMLLDLMVHDLDVARWWGGEVTRVYARARRGASGADYALVTLRHASGAMSLVEGGWAYPPGVFRTGFDVAGTDGLIEWRSDDDVSLRRFVAADGDGPAEVGLPLTLFADDPYAAQLHHAATAIRDGTPFSVGPADARAALALALAARRSIAEGRPVRPDEVEP